MTILTVSKIKKNNNKVIRLKPNIRRVFEDDTIYLFIYLFFYKIDLLCILLTAFIRELHSSCTSLIEDLKSKSIFCCMHSTEGYSNWWSRKYIISICTPPHWSYTTNVNLPLSEAPLFSPIIFPLLCRNENVSKIYHLHRENISEKPHIDDGHFIAVIHIHCEHF